MTNSLSSNTEPPGSKSSKVTAQAGHTKKTKNNQGDLKPSQVFSSPDEESAPSAGISASEESDSEFGISVSVTAASITKSVLRRKKLEKLEKLDSTTVQLPSTSISPVKPKSSLPKATESVTAPSFDPATLDTNLTNSDHLTPQLSSSTSSFGAVEYTNSSSVNSQGSHGSENEDVPKTTASDTHGFVIVKKQSKQREESAETPDHSETSEVADPEEQTPSTTVEPVIDPKSVTPHTESPSQAFSSTDTPIQISNVGPEFPIGSRFHSLSNSSRKQSVGHRSLRNRKERTYTTEKQTISQTDDFSNFSTDDENVTLSSESGRRNNHVQKVSRPCHLVSSVAPFTFSTKPVLTNADVADKPFIKLLNFEFAHAVEAFLLITPLIYAFYIRQRDSEFFSAIDALDAENSPLFEKSIDGSLDSPLLSMIFFHSRSSITFDFNFLVRFTLLTITFLLGIFQVVRLAYLSSQVGSKVPQNTQQVPNKSSLKHYAVSTFNAFSPEILYTGVLPPLLALATNPQHLAFFHANVLATLSYTPFPFLAGEADFHFPILIPPIKLPFKLPFQKPEKAQSKKKQTSESTELQLWTSKFVSLSNILSVRRIFCALLEPTLPSVLDHVHTFQEMLQVVVQKSLSQVETFLLSVLLVNLYYFGSFNTFKSSWYDPALASGPITVPTGGFGNIKNDIVPDHLKTELAIAATPTVLLRAILFGACLIALCPILPFVATIMGIEKFKTSRPLSVADKTKAYNTQIKISKRMLAAYIPSFVVVVFWLYLYTDLPNWSRNAVDASFLSQSLLFITGPLDFVFGQVLFPSQQVAISHLKIAGYWLTVLAITVPLVQSKSSSWSHVDLRRKVWHITVVLMFLPVGLPSHPTFTKVCMAGATFLFLAIEFIRVTTIPPVGPVVHASLLRYLDPRDTCGPIIVSHIFLLVGISVPMYLCNSPAGIICLGLGDAAASVLGRQFGRTKWSWPTGNKKTVEGTVAFVVASVIGMAIYKWIILQHFYPEQYAMPYVLDTYNPFASFEPKNATNTVIVDSFLSSQLSAKGLTLTKMVIVSTMTALLEAFSSMNDNVIVPLYMTALLQLC